MSHLLNLFCAWFILLHSFCLYAKDFGLHGHTFRIDEDDLLEVMRKKSLLLTKEEIESFQRKTERKIAQSLTEPSPVSGIKEAVSYRVSYFDPTVCAKEAVRDHEGKIIVNRGTCVNPLQNGAHFDDLLFFDATQPQHIDWAKNQSIRAGWILVKGKPIQLEEQEDRPVYFDQFGFLTTRLNIKHVPAKVSIEGDRLKIEEIPIEGGRE